MASAPPSHTESEKATSACSGEKPEVSRVGSGSNPRLGVPRHQPFVTETSPLRTLCYLSVKWRYTKTLKESTVREIPYRVVWKPRQEFHMSYI